MEPRHSRQTRLVDVGSEGQARLAAATVRVRGEGLAGEIEARYLAGAGIGTLVVRDSALAAAAQAVDPGVSVEVDAALAVEDEPPAPFVARDEAAREVATGAWRALRAFRAALEGR